MTSEAVLAAMRAVTDTDDVPGLTRIAEQLRRDHPDDHEAEILAKHALLKRRRLLQEA